MQFFLENLNFMILINEVRFERQNCVDDGDDDSGGGGDTWEVIECVRAYVKLTTKTDF